MVDKFERLQPQDMTGVKKIVMIQGGIKRFAIFSCVQVCGVYITLMKQFKPWEVVAVAGSIVTVGVLTRSDFFHYV